MVLYALVARAQPFRGRRGFWYIDNIAALMSLIRGRSSSPDLERLAQLIHVAMFALRAWFFFEYIPSKTSKTYWADAVASDSKIPGSISVAFLVMLPVFHSSLWISLSSRCLLRVFEFL